MKNTKNNKKNTKLNSLSDQELLEMLKSEYHRIKPKNQTELFEKSKILPSHTYLRKRFNMTINELLIKIGIPVEKLNGIRRPPNELLEKLKEVADELGHVPTAKEFNAKGYSSEALKNHFGSYSKALEAAGLEVKNKKFTKSELIKLYKNLSNQLGRPANSEDLNKLNDFPSASTFAVRFGGIKELKKSLGFKSSNRGGQPKYTKEDIMDMLIKEVEKKQRQLTTNELRNNKNLPCYTTILKYFNTTKISDVWKEVHNEMLRRKYLNSTIDCLNNKKILLKIGEKGESIVAHELSYLDKSKYIVYNNIFLSSGDKIQQIDHLVIGVNGIFHLETKYLSGEIIIEKNGTWTQVKGNVCKVIENPTGQVIRHERIIKEIINKTFDIHSCIVLANKKNKITCSKNSPIQIIKADNLLYYIKNYKPSKYLTQEDIYNIKKLIDNSILKQSNNNKIICS